MPHPQVGQPEPAKATHRALGCARFVYASVSSSPAEMLTMHRTTMRPLARNMYLQCMPMSQRDEENVCAASTPSERKQRAHGNGFTKASKHSVAAVSITTPCNGRTSGCMHGEPGQGRAYMQFGRQLWLKRAAS